MDCEKDVNNDLGATLKQGEKLEISTSNNNNNTVEVNDDDTKVVNGNCEDVTLLDEGSHEQTMEDEDEASLDTDIPTKLDNIDYEAGDICKFDGRRRSEPMKGLLLEQFPENIKGRKEAGFKTDRPLVWFKAIREYVVQNNIVTRCEVKTQKSQKVSIMKIHLTFRKTKEATITVKFVNGLIMVNSRATEEWVRYEFPKIKVPANDNNPDVIQQEVTQNTSDNKTTVPVDVKELADEITSIWSSVEELKKAFKTIENSLKNVIESVERNGVRMEDNAVVNTNKRKEMEVKLDQKDSLAKELMEIDMKKKTDKLTTDLNNKINSVREVVTAFKVETNRKIEVFKEVPDSLHNDLKSRMDSIDEKFDGLITSSEVKKDLDEMDKDHLGRLSDLETKLNKCEKVTRKVPEIERGLDVNKRQLSSLGMKIRSSEINFRNSLINKEHTEMIHERNEIPQSHDRNDTKSENGEGNNMGNDSQQSAVIASIDKILAESDEKSVSIGGSTNDGYRQDTESVASGEPEKIVDDKTELIMCFDSNVKYINQRKLWDLDGTKHIRCGTLDEVMDVINSNIEYSNLKYFFVSCGCNDLDYRNGGEVFMSIKQIVEKLKVLYPDIKIILSEITPRMDAADEKVKTTNTLLDPYSKQCDNVFLTRHSNMRKKEFFMPNDSKHFVKDCIPKFVSNIKYTLRIAYGRKKFEGGEQQRYHYPNIQQQFRDDQSRSFDPQPRTNDTNVLQEITRNDFLRTITDSISSSIAEALQKMVQ